jgi:hypothetical protein
MCLRVGGGHPQKAANILFAPTPNSLKRLPMNISNGYRSYLWMGLTMSLVSIGILLLMGKASGSF